MTVKDADKFWQQTVHAFGSPIVVLPQAVHDTTVSTTAAVLGVFVASLRLHLVLGVIVVGFMGLDLMTGVAKSQRLGVKFDRRVLYGGVLGKVLLLALVFVGFGLDAGLAALFPSGGPGGITQAYLTTTAVLVLLMVGEGLSVVNNVREAKVGGLAAIALLFRRFDTLKHQVDEGAPPPARRHYDALALEEEEDRRVEGGR